MKNLKQNLVLSGVLAIGLLTTTAPAFADHDASSKNSYYTYGRVIDAEPIIRRTVETIPHKECRPVRHQRRVRRDHHKGHLLPSLIGGLLGGAIGHQFGGGRGKTALTVVGALAGASIASDSAHRHDRQYTDHVIRQRCTVIEEVREVEIIEGYLVTYRYQGREFTRTTVDHPGSRIRIRVQVNPVTHSLAYNAYGSAETY